MRFEVVEGRPSYMEQIARLRVDAWAPQVAVIRELLPAGLWVDPHDEHAHHVTAWLQGQLVGAARICHHERIAEVHPNLRFEPEGAIAYISRLVVDPALRELGLASRMDAQRAQLARHLRARWVVVCWSSLSGTSRLQHLLNQGFSAFSDTSDDFPFPREEVQWLAKNVEDFSED